MRVNPELLRRDPAPSGRRRPQGSVWSTLAAIVKIAVVAVSAVVLYWLFSPSFAAKQGLLREIERLDQAIPQAEKEKADLDAELTALQHDPEHLARFARDKLNVARPNEVIFRFEPYQPGRPDAVPATPKAR